MIPPLAIGDSVVANPLFKTLHASFPLTRTTVVVRQALAPLYRLYRGVDLVVCAGEAFFDGDPVALTEVASHTALTRHFDIALDLHCTLPCRSLMCTISAERKIGMDFFPGEACPYSVCVPHFPPVENRSAVDLYLDYARSIDAKVLDTNTGVDLARLPPVTSPSTSATLGRLHGHLVIALLLAGGDWHKRYPPELVTRLIAQCPDPDVRMVAIFGSDEIPSYEPFVPAWRGVVAGGQLEIAHASITDMIHLLRISAGAIANDCGFMHIAVSLGLPTLALFGPSEPLAWFPYGDAQRHALVGDVTCRPCYGAERQACSRNRCMEDFSAEVIWAELGRLIKGGAGSEPRRAPSVKIHARTRRRA